MTTSRGIAAASRRGAVHKHNDTAEGLHLIGCGGPSTRADQWATASDSDTTRPGQAFENPLPSGTACPREPGRAQELVRDANRGTELVVQSLHAVPQRG